MMAETKTINNKTSNFPRINNELLRFKAFYFFCLSGFGSLMPYMPVYFRQMGLSASHVGFLIGIRPIVQFASAPFWAIMADRYRKRKPILVMSILAWLVMTLSLAFVEPTNQLCEMRVENNSTLQFVNYTKLRTGFFRRRSLAESATFATKQGIRSVTTSIEPESHRRNVNMVDRKKRTLTLKRGEKSPSKQSAASAHSLHSRTIWNLRPNISSVNETSKQPIIIQGTSNDSKNRTLSTIIRNKDSRQISHDNTQTTSNKQTGILMNKKLSLPKRLPLQRENDKDKPVYLKRGRKMAADNTNVRFPKIDDISNTRKRLGESNVGTKTVITSSQNKPKSQRSTIEFTKGESNADDSPSKIRIDHGGTSGSGEVPKSFGDQNTEKVSIPKHVKDAADKLQKQLTKSINILSKLKKNSTVALLHHTIKMLSKKDKGKTITQTSTPETIPQLHHAIKTFMKSTPGYKTSMNAEGSGTTDEGSSLLLSSENDLSHLAMSHLSPGNGVDGQDNLHRAQQQNGGVMHHNVLPHHVLALGHHIQGLTVQEMLSGHDESKSQSVQSGSGSGEPPSGRQSILDSILGNITNTQKDNNTPKDDYTTDITAPKQESLVVPVAFSEALNHANTTLRNLFKSNEHEMSRIFVILLVLIVVGEFLESPSATLADASLLEVLGEKKQFYGRQRLFGSIGFGVCSFIVGILLERSRHTICGEENVDYTICFCAFGMMMFMTFLVTTSFDFHYSDSQSSSGSVLYSLCNMHYGSCLVAACIMGIDFSMSHNFLAWLLEDLGGSKALMGLAVISRCFADTITFYFAGSIIKRIGQVHVMIMVLISYTVILLTFSVINNPAWVIPVEILDGITYALAWSALTSYLAGAVPPDSVTTIQGILQGVYWGLGSGSGAIVGGYLIHYLGVFQTFQFMAGLTLFSCLIFSTVQWKWTSTATANDQPQTKYTYLPTVETKDTDELLSGYQIPRLPTRIKGKFSLKKHITK